MDCSAEEEEKEFFCFIFGRSPPRIPVGTPTIATATFVISPVPPRKCRDRPLPIPSTSLPIHHSLIILHLDAIHSELLTTLLNKNKTIAMHANSDNATLHRVALTCSAQFEFLLLGTSSICAPQEGVRGMPIPVGR
jgi:hypothetical protein